MDRNLLFTSHEADNWFYKKYYYANGNVRYYTFQLALNLLNQRHSCPTIIETGCQREEDDFGAGMSTSIFAEYINRYGGHLITIDNNEVHLSRARNFVSLWPNISTQFILSDSVKALGELRNTPALVYLDSFDYPYGKLLECYGGQTDIDTAMATLAAMSDQEIQQKHGALILPCQEHCVNEYKAIRPMLADNTILLLDDNTFPGGGKPKLLKNILLQEGWVCLIDATSSLWIRG